jgi:hypothetical protein
MKRKKLSIVALSVLMVFVAFSTVEISAAAPPDLRVLLTGPSSAQVRSPYVYTVNVTSVRL